MDSQQANFYLPLRVLVEGGRSAYRGMCVS